MHFDQAGQANTEATLKEACRRGKELGIEEMVLASTTGATAHKALAICRGFRLAAVTYHGGYKEPFKSAMAPDTRRELEAKGVRVIQATHALSGVERSVAKKHSGVYPALLIADTLRLFGHGTKVAVEVAVMAADAGVLSGQDIIAIGGSGRGADTALVLKPACQSDLFDIRVREIICKPRAF